MGLNPQQFDRIFGTLSPEEILGVGIFVGAFYSLLFLLSVVGIAYLVKFIVSLFRKRRDHH